MMYLILPNDTIDYPFCTKLAVTFVFKYCLVLIIKLMVLVVQNPFLVVGQKLRCIGTDMDRGHDSDTDTAAQQNLMCPCLFCSVLLCCV